MSNITEIEGELPRLIATLDLNSGSGYNLRQTAARRQRLRKTVSLEDLRTTGQSIPFNTMTSTPTSTSTTVTYTSSVMVTSKFCGNVPSNVPNRQQYLAYDVNRWLADADTRIGTKNIQDESLKIKEAKLAVDPLIGDASRFLNTGRMCYITTMVNSKQSVGKCGEVQKSVIAFWHYLGFCQ